MLPSVRSMRLPPLSPSHYCGANLFSYAAACNSVSKLLPIIVDLVAFDEVLRNALDVIS